MYKKSVLENDPDFKVILDRYQKQCEVYPAEYEKYKLASDKWKADTSKKKGAAPAAPMGPTHYKSPYKLYNGMIASITNYKLKGVIWYQGESNADRAFQYRKLFPAMIAMAAGMRSKTVAMESTGVYWKQLYLVLIEHGFEVSLVNAKHVKNVMGRKTDMDDAQWIQKLHSCGLLTSSFLPDDATESLRSLVRPVHKKVRIGWEIILEERKQRAATNMQ